MKITKAVFVVLTAQRTGLSVYKTEKVLDAIIDKIKNIVGQGTTSVSKVGVFSSIVRAAMSSLR